MVAIIVVAVLGILALVTQAGVLWVQRAHPAPGTKIEVARQIGNAVPPALAAAIARHVHNLLGTI